MRTNDVRYHGLEEVFRDAPTIDVTDLRSSGAYLIGNQEKWYIPEEGLIVKAPFYYEGQYWKDFLVEVVASSLGKQLGFNVAEQYVCRIIDGDREMFGVASVSALKAQEDYTTFYRLLSGASDSLRELHSSNPWEMFQGIYHAYQETTGVDTLRYLFEMLVLDCLIGNEDRHMNNFGIGYSHVTHKSFTPQLFDFGLGLFETSKVFQTQSWDTVLQYMSLKPYRRQRPDVVWESISAHFTKQLYSYYDWCINLNGIVFPSFMAERYLRWMAELLHIRVEGKPILLKEEVLKYAHPELVIEKDTYGPPAESTLMFYDTPLIEFGKESVMGPSAKWVNTNAFLDMPFDFRQGKYIKINRDNMNNFFAYRAMPPSRQNGVLVEGAMNVNGLYDRIAATHAVCIDDHYWLRMPGETIRYEDVQIRLS